LKIQLCPPSYSGGHPLCREAQQIRWLSERATDVEAPRVARVEAIEERERDPSVGRWGYLLTTGVPGEPLHKAMEATPLRVARLAGRLLRWLHDRPVDGSLMERDIGQLLDLAEADVASGASASRLDARGDDPRKLEKRLNKLRKKQMPDIDPVVTHFDYCLPNVLAGLDDRVGLIDVGGLCLSDRHLDLATAIRSLTFNGARKDAIRTFTRWYGDDVIETKRLAYFSELCDLL
jgi:aminoglycoside phosphotransferase